MKKKTMTMKTTTAMTTISSSPPLTSLSHTCATREIFLLANHPPPISPALQYESWRRNLNTPS
jgi:hypothetical protein